MNKIVENKIDKILQQRGKEYGSFLDNAKFAMNFYYANSGITTHIDNLIRLSEDEINMTRYYIFMVGAKLGRLRFNPKHQDSIRDLFGYTKLYKQSCTYRFTFVPISAMSSRLRELLDKVNMELNEQTQEIPIHEDKKENKKEQESNKKLIMSFQCEDIENSWYKTE